MRLYKNCITQLQTQLTLQIMRNKNYEDFYSAESLSQRIRYRNELLSRNLIDEKDLALEDESGKDVDYTMIDVPDNWFLHKSNITGEFINCVRSSCDCYLFLSEEGYSMNKAQLFKRYGNADEFESFAKILFDTKNVTTAFLAVKK